MSNSRVFCEWPLVAFTFCIQVACALAIATTVADGMGGIQANSLLVRALGISVFPVAAAGLLLSVLHLGRPLSAWRAMSNFRSRLTLEVLLTGAFALSALAYSTMWWLGRMALLPYVGASASALGISAVVASASIYKLPSRPVWNAGGVMASFLGSTVLVFGVALHLCLPSLGGAIGAVFAGTLLLAGAAVRMWMASVTVERSIWIPAGFAAYFLLLASTPILLFFNLLPSIALTLACAAAAAGILCGRVLMFALGELQPNF